MRLAIASGTEAAWAELKANLKATEKVSDPRQLAQLDLEFHEVIVRAANHGRLLSSWLNLRLQIRLIMMQRNQADVTSRQGTVHGHRELVDAIVARDPAHHCPPDSPERAEHEWFIKSFTDVDIVDSETV